MIVYRDIQIFELNKNEQAEEWKVLKSIDCFSSKFVHWLVQKSVEDPRKTYS